MRRMRLGALDCVQFLIFAFLSLASEGLSKTGDLTFCLFFGTVLLSETGVTICLKSTLWLWLDAVGYRKLEFKSTGAAEAVCKPPST